LSNLKMARASPATRDTSSLLRERDARACMAYWKVLQEAIVPSRKPR
jgi:hypothetical protein